MMPVGQAAVRPMCSQIGMQPSLLRSFLRIGQITIQRYDMPTLEIITVVSLAGCSRTIPEVRIIRTRPSRIVIVIAWRGTRALFVSTPCALIAGGKFLDGSIGVGIIARRKDRSRDLVE